MSNTETVPVELTCPAGAPGTGGVEILSAREVPLGGPRAMTVRRTLPQRVLGRTKVQVPILGLGTVSIGNMSDDKEAVALLNRAIDVGVTYIDTAPGSTRQAIITGYGRAQRYLAGVLRETLQRLNLVLDRPPYNLVVHTAPNRDSDHEYYHWHIEIMPKLTKVAGFEWGSGFYINPTSPEEAAQYLRDIEP